MWHRRAKRGPWPEPPSAPTVGGSKQQDRGRSVPWLSAHSLCPASELLTGQHPSQQPNRIHIHERPSRLPEGLGTAALQNVTGAFSAFLRGGWARVAMCKQAPLLRARHVAGRTLPSGDAVEWGSSGFLARGRARVSVWHHQDTAGQGEGARTRSYCWRRWPHWHNRKKCPQQRAESTVLVQESYSQSPPSREQPEGPSRRAHQVGPPHWAPQAGSGHLPRLDTAQGERCGALRPTRRALGSPGASRLRPVSSVEAAGQAELQAWAFPSPEQELLRFSIFSGGRGPGESGCPSLGGKAGPGSKPTLILLQPLHPTGSSRRGGGLAGPQPGSAGPGSRSHSPLSWPAPRQAGRHLRVAGQLRLLRPPCPGSRTTGAVLQMKQRHREKGQACHQGPEGQGTAKGQLRQHVRPTHHPASKNPLKLWRGCPQ